MPQHLNNEASQSIEALDVLVCAPAKEVLTKLVEHLAAGSKLSPDQLIALAYIAGVEDGIAGMAGRAEYDLRTIEFLQVSRPTLIDTGRFIGKICLEDTIQQAQADR